MATTPLIRKYVRFLSQGQRHVPQQYRRPQSQSVSLKKKSRFFCCVICIRSVGGARWKETGSMDEEEETAERREAEANEGETEVLEKSRN